MTIDLVKHPKSLVHLKKARFRLWDKDWNLLEEHHGARPPKHWSGNVTAVNPRRVCSYLKAEEDGAAYHDNFLKGRGNL